MGTDASYPKNMKGGSVKTLKTLSIILVVLVGTLYSIQIGSRILATEGREFKVLYVERYTAGHTLGGLGALWNNRVLLVAEEDNSGRLHSFDIKDGRGTPYYMVGDRFKVLLGEVYPHK